jgi:GntR family transcriptional repressor for pyruvate dehydrogenase complex
MLQKLQRETLAARAATSLLDYIRAQQLKPGDELPPEMRLAEEFGVSRPVIREALKSLEGRGVIETISGKGAVIRSIDSGVLLVFFSRAMQINKDTLIELMEVRKGVEVESAALAAQRRAPEELAQMAETVAAMRAHIRDVDAYSELDLALHLQIARASHNAMIYHLVESIREAAKDAILEGLRHRRTPEQLERVQALHELLLDHLRRGDADGARRAMMMHFDEAVIALLSDGGPQDQDHATAAMTGSAG